MNQEDLLFLSAVELAAGIRKKKISPVEVTRALLDRVKRMNPTLNAYCSVHGHEALDIAKKREGAVMSGDLLGPLHGVPVSIKDVLHVKDWKTTFGSQLQEDSVATVDAPSVERLRRAGAILIGQTNTPEYGWKGVTDNRRYGATRNPWNLKLTPGGSSGGAAAAVAAGLGPIGIGTDGGGSIRIPAAFCGLVGLKASFGRVPNFPPSAIDSLRHIGPLTRTVADAALTLSVLAGADCRDPSSVPEDGANYLDQLDHGVEGLRIAYSSNLGCAQLDSDVERICRQASSRLVEVGASVEEVEVDFSDAYDIWHMLFYTSLSALLEKKVDTDGNLMDLGLRQLVQTYRGHREVDLLKAQANRNAFCHKVSLLFRDHNLLVTPTLAVSAFPVGQDEPEGMPSIEPRPLQWTLTYPFNVTGHPVISLPCGWINQQLPVGLQIIGRPLDDRIILRVARAIEILQPWANRRPNCFDQ